jgi:subtilisin family serine protease
MKKYSGLLTSFTLLALSLMSFAGSKSQTREQAPALYAHDRILVKIKSDAQLFSNRDQVLPARGARAEAIGVEGSGGLYLIHLDKTTTVEQAIKEASADPQVEFAEPDYFLYPSTVMPDDTFFNRQWNLLNMGEGGAGKPGADIGATRAWELTTGSDDVVVAILDTGTDLSHPDLAPNAWVNTREVAGNGVDDDSNGFVDDIHGWNFVRNSGAVFETANVDFHGTAVAGVIGARGNNGIGVSGIAWRVKLLALKFLSAEGGSTSDAVKAINYAIALRKKGVNLRVINASWGGPGNVASLRSAIMAAGDAGILFVSAAGNGGADGVGDNIDDKPDYPSAWTSEIPSLISVAALDMTDQLTEFSNYGLKNVCVGAPGEQIVTTLPESSYGWGSGTSFAAPHVSGIAALIWSRESSLSPTRVRERIVSTAEPVLSLASKSINAGRANAFYASSNTPPPAGQLAINAVKASKKELTVDGLGFISDSSIIEVNGSAISRTRYNSDYRQANGTLTRLSMKPGKKGMNLALPKGVPVSVVVYNPATGERTAPFTYTRF